MSRIVLLGFMGAGKSSVGAVLSARLGWPLIELDQEIEAKAGKKIATIFDEDGEEYFRELEAGVLEKAITSGTPVIISPGGGLVESPQNRSLLKKSESDLVFLRTRFSTIEQRLVGASKEGTEDRPLFRNINEAKVCYLRRESLYAELAELIIDTDYRTPEELASFLLPLFDKSKREKGKQLCLVVGNPISHSRSPAIHEAALSRTGLSDRFLYGAISLEEEQLESLVQLVRDGVVRGLSVTIPFKERFLQYVDQVDEAARLIGAINTIYLQDGKVRGSNTDWVGILQALQSSEPLPNRPKVAVIGAGGTAKAAVYAAKQLGGEVCIYNRTVSRAQRIGSSLGAQASSLDLFHSSEFEIIIQTTSVGMGDPALSPVRFEAPNQQQVALDLVYTPRQTRFLVEAAAKGARTVSGEEVFLAQAAMQFELFFGSRAPLEAMKSALNEDGG